MIHTSFLSHDRFKFLWVALGLGFLSGLLYIFHDPKEPPNGGTWLGYGLGTVGAVLILWLTLSWEEEEELPQRIWNGQGVGFSPCLSWSSLADRGDIAHRFSVWLEYSYSGISAYVYSYF